MPSVQVDGANLWYEIQGEGEPLTLIGGVVLLHNQWDFVNPHLLQRGYRLIHWNYRGVGRSDWRLTEPHTLERWVDDLKAVLDDAQIERTNIWAASFASAIGIRFASKYPDRTKALVAFPWFRTNESYSEIFRVSSDVARVFGSFALARVYAGLGLPPEVLHTRDGIEFEQFEARVFDENLNVRTLTACLKAYSSVDLTADVAALECPVLLLMGSDSPLTELEGLPGTNHHALVAAFRELKPNAEVRGLEGGGSTYFMLTKPAESAEIVAAYFARTAALAPR